MVWGAISASGRSRLVFIPKNVKINGVEYRRRVLQKEVSTLGGRLFKGRKPWLFTQDGAPSHTATDTQNWFTARGINFLSKTEWPPSSPDLNPLDFCIWGMLQERVGRKVHTDVNALKKALRREWGRLPTSVLRNSCMAVPRRLQAVIDANGGHIE